MRSTLVKLVSLALLTAVAAASPRAGLASDMRVVIGASPAGGYDQTGRAIGKALQEAGIAANVRYEYKTGAGGTLALTHFVEQRRGDATSVLVSGAVMVGATIQNNTPITLAQATPIARLITECNVIVVRPDSPFKRLSDVLDQMRRVPGSVTWGGGSKGSVDHVGVVMVAQVAGLDPARVNYVPFRGGGEASVALLGGHVAVATSGWGEMEPLIKSGRLRALALTADSRPEGIDVPTLREQGIDVGICNWRGLHAAPGITVEQRNALVQAVTKAARMPSWTEALQAHRWEAALLVGDEFGRFVQNEQARIRALMARLGM